MLDRVWLHPCHCTCTIYCTLYRQLWLVGMVGFRMSNSPWHDMHSLQLYTIPCIYPGQYSTIHAHRGKIFFITRITKVSLLHSRPAVLLEWIRIYTSMQSQTINSPWADGAEKNWRIGLLISLYIALVVTVLYVHWIYGTCNYIHVTCTIRMSIHLYKTLKTFRLSTKLVFHALWRPSTFRPYRI